MEQQDYLPEPPVGRLIDYETATVITQMMYPPKPVLVVNGAKPRPGMDVTLVPVTYLQQPAFWEIHVLGAPGFDEEPATSAAYSVEIDLASCSGTVGVEVVGANRTERIVVPTSAAVEE